ncbi:helix-turn-helix transcriptional regulator [Limnoraphis robusta Tam1]|uniref:helix-turn-helix domain-containing protein n=1 Tax=Limnoraphis robusta TaxID=1118279 RepID=UPI00061AE290|nr:helix-turn-helix domain-containing protein [Limnoraphis robusta]MEA5538157.1 helix-turn-helix transcriptional regulator [Limnoraphis robusta Tam1]
MSLGQAFGQILKQKRETLKLTQEQLAFEVGLHRTYISLLERGIKSPTLDVIFRISMALNISPSELIREVEQLYFSYKRDT